MYAFPSKARIPARIPGPQSCCLCRGGDVCLSGLGSCGALRPCWERTSSAFQRRHFFRRAAGPCRVRAWLHARPALEAWIYPEVSKMPEASYRKYNGWYFSQFSEQERMLADAPG